MGKLEILDKIEKVVYVTQPSPIVLVSTISNDNIENVAPFGMFMNCSTKPDNMIAIAISPKTDTYRNIIDTKEFIIGIPQESMLSKLYKAGDKYDSAVNEFELTGLTPYQSKTLKCKRIRDCVVNIDCVFVNEMKTGNHHIIVGKVVACDIDEELFSNDKVELRCNIPRIYHITSNQFMVDDILKSVK